MALNLLDSLSTTAATPEKNPFSLKNKESPSAGATEFGLLFGAMMNPALAQALASTEGKAESAMDKDLAVGQKIAIEGGDVAPAEASAALLATQFTTPMSDSAAVAADSAAVAADSAAVAADSAAASANAALAASAKASTSVPTVSPSVLSAPALSTPPIVANHAPPALTAVVLSRNMTAITPSQSVADGDSLVAFAKSQGLDEAVAAWLFAAGKGTASTPQSGPGETGVVPPSGASTPDQTPEPSADQASTQVDPALANAALAMSLLASARPGAAPALASSAGVDSAPAPVQLMPTAMPAAWLSTRPAVAGKSTQAAPALPQAFAEKNDTHTSDLDLTLIFGQGKDPVKTAPLPPASFTPAAWVMAGLAGQTEQSAALASASTLVKSLSMEPQADEGNAQANALNPSGGDRNPTKLSDPLSGSAAAKASEPGMTTAERREMHQGQAEKMGQAIGLRMLSEMEKGHWHLKMMLKPANLGHIEVEMRMRQGELDANFTASQAATRDLLQDGLPKLKDTLNQMGMDVASMNIGGGSNPKNGGDPTPQQTPTVTPAAKIEQQEESTTIERAQITPSSQDGLDVLV